MTKIPLKAFYFLRHGQTDWNLEHKAMGSQDIPVNARGLSQAHVAKEILRNEHIGTIVHSPLKRAHQTAEILKQYISVPKIEVSELKEACWGEKEGKDKGDGSWIKAWREGDEIKNAESYSDFRKRVIQGLQKALQYPGPVLMVSHGGVYWVIQEALGLPVADLKNCEPIFHQPPDRSNKLWRVLSLSGNDNYESY